MRSKLPIFRPSRPVTAFRHVSAASEEDEDELGGPDAAAVVPSLFGRLLRLLTLRERRTASFPPSPLLLPAPPPPVLPLPPAPPPMRRLLPRAPPRGGLSPAPAPAVTDDAEENDDDDDDDAGAVDAPPDPEV